jgi:single-stranded DNA-binding protein
MFAKGNRIMVVGRYKTDEYTTKAGEKKTVMEVLVDDCGPSIRFELPNDTRPKFSDSSSPQELFDEAPF